MNEQAATNLTGLFPQAHLDQMRVDARDPSTRPILWTFDGGAWNRDSAESAFVARQLESIRQGLYKVEFPELKGSRLCSASTEDDTGAEFVTFTITEGFGQVLVSRDMSGATPMVEVKTLQQSTGIFSLRLGYAYSHQEARAALMARRPLITDKAMEVRAQMERKLDDIIFQGESTVGLKGLINQSGTLTYSTPIGIAGSKGFATKSADEVLLDLNAAPNAIVSNSLEILRPNTALFPTTVWLELGARRVGDGTSEQISSYWKRTVQNITTVETTFKLETAGGSSSRRIVFYENAANRVEYALPQPFEQFAPQVDGLMVTTISHMRTAGVILKQPKSMSYADNV